MKKQFIKKGSFLYCDGPARKEGAEPFQKKVCFATTDKELLSRLLEKMVELEECYFVKYSIEPKAGMYLGRCFFTSPEQVGKTWAKYKAHPKLFCNVQDDQFIEMFRKEVVSWDELDPEKL